MITLRFKDLTQIDGYDFSAPGIREPICFNDDDDLNRAMALGDKAILYASFTEATETGEYWLIMRVRDESP